ncbi:MAG TPA: cupredoxin family copper-binding protein [Candidatus Acidoferrales bacterium]|jgi:amicyanin|nr:cupredoxin family copper-binding protein [Candidatus Acidoferrales bacterium]
MRNLLTFSSVALAAVLLLIFGLSAATYPRPVVAQPKDPIDSHQVAIDNFSFTPASLTVSAGTTVTWINRDDVPHTVVSTEKKFKSPVLDTDEQFSYKFTDPGTYEYYCSIHPKMTGTVVVQ